MRKNQLPPEYLTHSKVVFVEDLLTKEYLNTIWADSMSVIKICVTPGSQGVRCSTEYWSTIDSDRFYGIVDGDFDTVTNELTVSELKKRNLFQLPAHEIENYLIDIDAIVNSDFNVKTQRNNSFLEELVSSFTRNKKYWFAACYVLSKIESGLRRGHNTPTLPSMERISSSKDILNYVSESGYISSIHNYIEQTLCNDLDGFVHTCIAEVEKVYSDNKERLLFSGKQIFKHIRGNLYNPPNSDTVNLDIDLAVEIAEYQREQNNIPSDIATIIEYI